jgi:hypothetical protein
MGVKQVEKIVPRSLIKSFIIMNDMINRSVAAAGWLNTRH